MMTSQFFWAFSTICVAVLISGRATAGEGGVGQGAAQLGSVVQAAFDDLNEQTLPRCDGCYHSNCGAACNPSDCECCGQCLDWMLSGRIATSYASVPGETRSGGEYGLDLAVKLYEDWGFVASATANHVSGGSQFLGTVGFAKVADPCGGCWDDPFSATLLFDQFTDSRVRGNLYLSQIRAQLGYAWSDHLEFGATYSDGTNQDNTLLFVPFFGGNVPGTLRQSATVGGYVGGWLGDSLLWTIHGGYQNGANTFELSGSLLKPISDRTQLFVAASYDDRRVWGGLLGMELRFGPGASGRCCSGCGDCVCYDSGGSSGYVVRGQNDGSVSSPKLQYNDPPEQRFNRRDVTGEGTEVAARIDRDIRTWTELWWRSVQRQQWANQASPSAFLDIRATHGNPGLNPFSIELYPGGPRIQKGL